MSHGTVHQNEVLNSIPRITKKIKHTHTHTHTHTHQPTHMYPPYIHIGENDQNVNEAQPNFTNKIICQPNFLMICSPTEGIVKADIIYT